MELVENPFVSDFTKKTLRQFGWKDNDAIPADLSGLLLKIKELEASLRKDFGIQRPKIAVFGVNPHAGENGKMGTEEAEIITPAINQARAEDIKQQFDFVVSRAVAPLEQLLFWTYKKYKKLNSNEKTNGLICLKGGDLHQEISDAHNYLKASKIPQNITLKNISEWYSEDFFETKKLVYCAL